MVTRVRETGLPLGWARRPAFHARLAGFLPRFRDRRFWVTQSLVLFIAFIHIWLEASGLIEHESMLYFIPVSLFFFPLLYAALNFGLPGATATGVWIILLNLPNWILWHTGAQRLGVIFEMLVLCTAAVLIASRVDKERRARLHAETTERALQDSELKYRLLFQSSPVALLVLEADGTVVEANATACNLFGKGPNAMRLLGLAGLIGEGPARAVLHGDGEMKLESFRLPDGAGRDRYLQPISFATHGPGRRGRHITLGLWNITEARNYEAGLKAYAASVLGSLEEERRHIARELHDDIIQEMVLLYRRLDSAEASAAAAFPAVPALLRDARDHVEEATRRLRRFTMSLRPPALDDLGVLVSIRRLLVDLSDRAGIETDFKVTGCSRRLSPEAELGLFRIVQEALRNIERHAAAAGVTVAVAFDTEEVRLEITDDGRGFPELPLSPGDTAAGHFGIVGMRERAALLGGWLEVSAAAAGGARIVAAVRA